MVCDIWYANALFSIVDTCCSYKEEQAETFCIASGLMFAGRRS